MLYCSHLVSSSATFQLLLSVSAKQIHSYILTFYSPFKAILSILVLLFKSLTSHLIFEFISTLLSICADSLWMHLFVPISSLTKYCLAILDPRKKSVFRQPLWYKIIIKLLSKLLLFLIFCKKRYNIYHLMLFENYYICMYTQHIHIYILYIYFLYINT